MAVFQNALLNGNQPVVLYDGSGNLVQLSNPQPVTLSGDGLDVHRMILAELRGIRKALVFLATEGRRCKESDFDPPDLDADDLSLPQ